MIRSPFIQLSSTHELACVDGKMVLEEKLIKPTFLKRMLLDCGTFCLNYHDSGFLFITILKFAVC